VETWRGWKFATIERKRLNRLGYGFGIGKVTVTSKPEHP